MFIIICFNISASAKTFLDLYSSISNKASFNPSGTLIYSTAATTVIAGSASLVKTDRDTGEVLPGAVFKVIDANGQTIAENLTTNEQGIVQTGVLLHGSYLL